jgi:hypothetical protein
MGSGPSPVMASVPACRAPAIKAVANPSSLMVSRKFILAPATTAPRMGIDNFWPKRVIDISGSPAAWITRILSRKAARAL